MVIVCDEQRRILQPILVEEIDLDPPADTGLIVNNLVAAILGACPEACVLVALARPGPLRIGARDQAWARFIEEACGNRLPLLGVHLVTPRGSVPIDGERRVA